MATSIKRMLGTDGSTKYQTKIGTIASIVTLPVASIVTHKKVSPIKASIITAAATTAAAIVLDKTMDGYYTKTEYCLMFGMLTGMFAVTFKNL